MKIPAGHGETILLVEDEASILNLGKKLLEKLEYRVLDANGPDRTMDLAVSCEGKVHLLISDVVMPGMNGRDLAD